MYVGDERESFEMNGDIYSGIYAYFAVREYYHVYVE